MNDTKAICDTSVVQGANTSETEAAVNEHEPLMNIDELAMYLNVPKSWVYEQSRLKKIPLFKAGKYLRFDRRAVLRWMVDKV
jgi:excisionase family DNA binding protein